MKSALHGEGRLIGRLGLQHAEHAFGKQVQFALVRIRWLSWGDCGDWVALSAGHLIRVIPARTEMI